MPFNLRMNSLTNQNPNAAPATPRNQGAYSKLLGDGGFQSFLWTQFLAAFNDNVYKMIVQVTAVAVAATSGVSDDKYLAIANAVFVIPFLLFAGPAGQIADRFSKTRVLQFTKLFEIPVMLFGIAAHAIPPASAMPMANAPAASAGRERASFDSIGAR